MKQKRKIIVLSFRRKQIMKDITDMSFKTQLKYYAIRRDNIKRQADLNVTRKELCKMYKVSYQNLHAILHSK